jgi:hypothetical protein
MSDTSVTTRTRYQFVSDQRWFMRLMEVVPGALSWTLLLGPIILSLFDPVIVAYFIVAYDLFWLMRALRMSTYLVRGYARVRQASATDWKERLEWLKDPAPYIKKTDRHLEELLRQHPLAGRALHITGSGWRNHRRFRQLTAELDMLKSIEAHHATIMSPESIYHLAIVATYNESRDIIEPTIRSLAEANFPSKQIMLVIAYEERGGAEVKQTCEALIREYGHHFAYATAIMHPDGIAGEVRGKGGNISFAGRAAAAYVEKEGIDAERVVVTTFDADNRPDTQYFSYLSYAYATNPNRIRKSYQPVPMYTNNIWDVPAPMRVVATGNSFFQIQEMMRPRRLRNFSSHAQPLRALIETDFWSVTSLTEDGHQFWRSFFAFDGDHEVVPLYIPVYQDAVLSDTYRKTFIGQYKQLRRWAYGITDFPFVMQQNLRNKQIPFGNKVVHTWRLLEGHVSWATTAPMIAFVAWLPLFLNQRFSHYELAHQLPIIASRLQTVALIGLVITISISVISLPPRPKRYTNRRSFAMILQWVMLPVTGILFNTAAAIDAQTRLMLGRYFEEFQVTDKSRKR